MLKVIQMKTAELKPYGRNPRKNESAVEAVANSIKEFGFRVPIVVDKHNIVVCGHTRLKAAERLGLEEVPVTVAEDLTEAQIRAFRLADNKTAELAEWDIPLLNIELENLVDELDMTDFGFDLSVLDEEKEIEEDDVPTIDEENEPITKLGDVWKLGNHRLICGDSTDAAVIEKLACGWGSIDLLVTDPPYNVAYTGKTADALTIENDKMSSDKFHEFLVAAFRRAYECLKPGAAFYVWYASREHINFESALKEVGLEVREQLIWVKNSLVLSRQDYHWRHEPCLYGWKEGAAHNWYADRTQTTVLEFNRPSRNAEHPTMKPLDLIGYLIKNSSKHGDTVLDLFGGSGSTLIACEQLGRTCYTCELDPRYCDVIIKRWENLTGQKAVRE